LIVAGVTTVVDKAGEAPVLWRLARLFWSQPMRSHRGFTRTEAVVIGIVIVLGVAFLIFIRTKQDRVSNRVDCAKNLQQIGQALLLYANDNKGQYPRVRRSMVGDGPDPDPKPTFGTGAAATQPFADDGPAPNDVTAALFLLAREWELIPQRFICPSSSNIPDNFDPRSAAHRSNFTDYRKNLSYSYANPYPSVAAISAGYRLSSVISAEFAVVADKNPGVAGGSDVLSPKKDSPVADIRKANTKIHRGDGQNVLFGDGHVAFEPTPFCGVNQDNIYATGDGKINASPADANDSILLPAEE
jgi:prepilin-type processing-associated H-X9-DG protein